MVYIEAYNDKRIYEVDLMKQQMYMTSNLTATFVSLALNGKEIPAYNEVFADDKNANEPMTDKDYAAMMMYKEAFIDFAGRHNNKLNKKRGNE